jgi:hypothetical protein
MAWLLMVAGSLASSGEACYAATMTSYTVLTALATLLSVTGPPPGVASLSWSRSAPGQSITIDAVPAGTDMTLAQADVEATATLVDAIRTLRPHVIWRVIRWRAGRMTVEMIADSAIHANVATLALKRLFPGRSTAGTGIRQARRATVQGFGWSVRCVIAARRSVPRDE